MAKGELSSKGSTSGIFEIYLSEKLALVALVGKIFTPYFKIQGVFRILPFRAPQIRKIIHIRKKVIGNIKTVGSSEILSEIVPLKVRFPNILSSKKFTIIVTKIHV